MTSKQRGGVARLGGRVESRAVCEGSISHLTLSPRRSTASGVDVPGTRRCKRRGGRKGRIMPWGGCRYKCRGKLSLARTHLAKYARLWPDGAGLLVVSDCAQAVPAAGSSCWRESSQPGVAAERLT